MFYYGYHFWGMHLIWWFIWLVFIFWIFAIPYGIPGQRYQRETPLEILKRRFASGQITKEQFEDAKRIL